MSRGIRKGDQIRLDPAHYRELKMQILERDGWKCQHCGRRDQLQIHHMIRRSQSGADGEENLIVLCRGCHSLAPLWQACGLTSVALYRAVTPGD